MKLTLQTYLDACKAYGICATGGVIWDYLRASKVKYYGGRCPVYQIEYRHNGNRVVVGGRYASNGKPELTPNTELDFT